MRFWRARIGAIPLLVTAIGLLPATRGQDPPRGKGPDRGRVSLETLREMKELARQARKKGPVEESTVGESDAPRQGVPESVLKYLASRASARTMRTSAPRNMRCSRRR